MAKPNHIKIFIVFIFAEYFCACLKSVYGYVSSPWSAPFSAPFMAKKKVFGKVFSTIYIFTDHPKIDQSYFTECRIL